MKQFKCILCGEYEYVTVKEVLRGGGNAMHAVRCKKCGLEQLFPLPSVEEDEEYYDENAHDKGITPEFSIDEIYEKFKYQNESRIRYLEDFGAKKSWKILDMASGYGFFMQMMKSRGYEVEGVEISKDRLAVCYDKMADAKIYTINLLVEEVPKELCESYDLVTMFHLLEHITNPVLFLKRLKEFIKTDGYLVLELPNVDNLMMNASPQFNDFFYFRDHVAYYTPKLLKRVLEEAGYEIIQLKGNQLYGLTNHFNWIINGVTEFKKPSYETCESMKWLEKIYKDKLNEEVKAEYMYAIAKKKKEDVLL